MPFSFGEGDRNKMKSLVFRASKLGILFHAVFLIPLATELPYVLKLWLVTPPAYLTFICLAELVMQLMDIASQSHLTAIFAKGNIRGFRIRTSSITLFTLPVAILTVALGASGAALAAQLAIQYLPL